MKNVFTVTAPTTAITLDGSGCGESSITVTNVASGRIDGRIRIVPSGQTKIDWLTISETPADPGAKPSANREIEGAFVPNESRQYVVRIAVPADAPSGSYQFRTDAYAVDEPDETCARGPDITVNVQREKAAVVKKFPMWIPIAAGIAILLAGGIVTTILLLKKEPAAHVEPAPITVTVPNVIGVQLEEARKVLATGNLVPQSVTERSDGKAAGTVLDQDPKPEAVVDPNTPVALIVEATKKPIAIKVPRVVDMSQDEAKKALAQSGLAVGDIVIDFVPGSKDDRVLRQTPAEGTYDHHVAIVNIVVQAPSSVVPNVMHKSVEDARAALERAHLQIDEKSVMASRETVGFEVNTVMTQDINAGTRVRQGTPVAITVVRQFKRPELIGPRLEAIKVQPTLDSKRLEQIQPQQLKRIAPMER
jgi:beta-lactam-binding protein with PASTA domain